MLQSNEYPANFIYQANRPPRGTTKIPSQPENALPTTWRLLPYIQDIYESVVRRLNLFRFKIAHKPHSVLRSNLVHVKDPSRPYRDEKSFIKSHAPHLLGLVLHWTNRPPSRDKAKRSSGLSQATRYKLGLAVHCMD